MTAPRIARRELPGSTRQQSGSGKTRRLGRALTSPAGILIVFPSLVLIVGLFLTLTGQSALKDSNVALGQRQLGEQGKLAARHLRGALGQADPMLDQLASFALVHGPEKPIEAAAVVLRDSMRGRDGVAYASLSFPDGTFQGAYLDTDRALRFQDSRVREGHTRVRRYDYAGRERLTLLREETSQYDPRQRDFYRLASEAGAKVWTKPYPFYLSHYTGVTRAAPVYRSEGGQRRLHAIATVDFDVNALSRFLRQGELRDVHTLLFAGDGSLLAYPQGEQRIAELPLRPDRPLSYRDLGDVRLDAFFGRLSGARRAEAELLSFQAGGTPYVATLAKVSDDASLDWSVAHLVPEQVFFESLYAYRKRSAAIAALFVLFTFGISLAFARLVIRVRRETASARAEAQRARQAARELGSYRLVRRLGQGGMGEVWQAEHRLLARDAAIKLIRVDVDEREAQAARERFRREAQTLAALRSRNTIELFDYGVADDGTFFYVMELLDGLDLEHLVRKHGAQPPGRVLRLLAQASRSLAEAHDAGIVHRDIKPANLFVCRAADEVDVVKVLDFGLVQAQATGAAAPEEGAAKLTREGMVMGTPDFIAPEQALGQPLDGRTDLYALGCVGYWLLTARLVFSKNSAVELLVAHAHEPPPPLERHAPQPVPPALKAIIEDCLAKAPEQRPPSARELLRRLLEAEAALPPQDVWTEARAHAWWLEHRPQSPKPASQPPAAEPGLRIADAAGG